MKTKSPSKAQINHGKCLDLLMAISKTDKLLEKLKEHGEWQRITRQRNILYREYNLALSMIVPLEVKETYFESVLKSLSGLTAKGLKIYFEFIVPVDHPGIHDLCNLDFDKFQSIQNVGINCRKELQLYVQAAGIEITT